MVKDREDGPAFQWWYLNGQKKSEWWYLNGQKKSEWWYLNGKLHRE